MATIVIGRKLWVVCTADCKINDYSLRYNITLSSRNLVFINNLCSKMSIQTFFIYWFCILSNFLSSRFPAYVHTQTDDWLYYIMSENSTTWNVNLSANILAMVEWILVWCCVRGCDWLKHFLIKFCTISHDEQFSHKLSKLLLYNILSKSIVLDTGKITCYVFIVSIPG